MTIFKDILLVILTGVLAILIAVTWKGESIYSQTEYDDFMYRQEQGEGLQ